MNARRLTWLGGLCSLLVGALVVPAALPAGGDTGGRPQLYLDTSGGVAAIDAESGASTFTATDARASGDWSRLVAAAPSGSTTRVSTIDALDGTTVDAFAVDGTNDVRVVSFRGDQVALSPHPLGRDGRQPGRARTTLVIAATDGSRARTYDLPGNIEPEAFSSDGRAVFVIDYLPALDPDRYQVRRLDLTTGELGEVPSPDGVSQGQMPGVARTNVMAADGSRLYTLYTSAGEDGRPYSFVHVLDLDEQWAHCVDLPAPFGRDPEALGLTVSPNGAEVYVADVATGRLAAVPTDQLVVDRVGRMSVRGRQGHPHLTATNALVFVGIGRTLAAVQSSSLVLRYQAALPDAVRGLTLPPAQNLLYVAQRSTIDGRDPADGSVATTVQVRLPSLTGIEYGTAVPGGATVKCAC